jgi:hypothetical protein
VKVEPALHGASQACNAQLLYGEAAAASTRHIWTNHFGDGTAHLDLFS